MKIKLYQIAPEKDDKKLMFMSYKFTVLHGGINADTYELVFDGDLPAQTAEDVFRIFNLKHPNGYRGRSMLVCGNRLSNGMRGEIAKAALLRMPITVFDEGLYLEVQKLVTQNNGNKKSVKLDRENFPMAFTDPESYLENAALFK